RKQCSHFGKQIFNDLAYETKGLGRPLLALSRHSNRHFECPLSERCKADADCIYSMWQSLWPLARDHRFRPGPARNRWRLKDREVSVAAGESIETDLAVSHGCKLTAQKPWRGTVLGRRRVGVDNADTRARLKRGNEIVEQTVGLGDLVIHVHQDCNVE